MANTYQPLTSNVFGSSSSQNFKGEQAYSRKTRDIYSGARQRENKIDREMFKERQKQNKSREKQIENEEKQIDKDIEKSRKKQETYSLDSESLTL